VKEVVGVLITRRMKSLSVAPVVQRGSGSSSRAATVFGEQRKGIEERESGSMSGFRFNGEKGNGERRLVFRKMKRFSFFSPLSTLFFTFMNFVGHVTLNFLNHF
jgi:hypothetical protein